MHGGIFFLTAHICTGNRLTCCSQHPTDSSKSSTFMLIYGWNQISMRGWNDISLSSWWMLWQLSPPSSTPRRLQPDGGQRPVKALQGSAGGTLRSRWVMDSYKSVPRGSDEEARRNDVQPEMWSHTCTRAGAGWREGRLHLCDASWGDYE